MVKSLMIYEKFIGTMALKKQEGPPVPHSHLYLKETETGRNWDIQVEQTFCFMGAN